MLFLHVTRPSVYKSSCPIGCRAWGRESAFGQMSTTPTSQLPASEIKRMFLSTNLACLLAFEWLAAGPHAHTPPSVKFPEQFTHRKIQCVYFLLGCLLYSWYLTGRVYLIFQMCLIKFPQVCLPIPGMSPQFPMCVYLDLGNIANSPVCRLWPVLIPLFLRSVYTDLGGFPKSSSMSTLTRDVSLIPHAICWPVFPW